MGVGRGGGFVAVGVFVGGNVFVGVGVGPGVDVTVAVAVFVAVGGEVGELVVVATMGGNNVFVGESVGDGVSVDCCTNASPGASPLSCSAAWLTSSGRVENMPNAESSRTTRNRMPTHPTPSI